MAIATGGGGKKYLLHTLQVGFLPFFKFLCSAEVWAGLRFRQNDNLELMVSALRRVILKCQGNKQAKGHVKHLANLHVKLS